MNEQTGKLIRELADRLGTTAEHIWGVLVRQALISGITNLIVCAAWCVFIAWGYRLLRRKTKGWETEGLALAWSLWCIVAISMIIIAGCSLESIVAALINPEYWALKQVIGERHQ